MSLGTWYRTAGLLCYCRGTRESRPGAEQVDELVVGNGHFPHWSFPIGHFPIQVLLLEESHF